MTAGGNPPASGNTTFLAIPRQSHRRSSPTAAKSLPPRKKQKLAHSHPTSQHQDDLPQITSQDSGSADSASKWFQAVNNNVQQGQTGSHNVSDDVSFYLDTEPAAEASHAQRSLSEERFGPKPSQRFDDEKDDLREVIDDLTVENKRLKALLKNQRLRPSAARESNTKDRLFELRVHGLPADKKRELEVLLRSFAGNVSKKPSSGPSSSATYGSSWQNNSTGSRATSSQDVSKLVQTDSGYASNANSGSRSQKVNNTGDQLLLPVSKRSRNTSIKNYLHDIPDSLLPRQSPYMTDRAKMALVVRRLEQLFTGKIAAPGEHSQPIQQQEVSNSAARADATENDKRGSEGAREAHVLHPDTKLNLDAPIHGHSPPDVSQNAKTVTSDTSTDNCVRLIGSRPRSPEQRPTRPLDLDIHRAQVAAENIEYLRHLGFNAPQFHSSSEQVESPWIYLNLLTSMAQLHTINVTPAFVRRAVRKMSKRFELSPDGFKVRWKGGPEATMFSGDDERAMDTLDDTQLQPNLENRLPRGKNSKTSSSSNNYTSEEPLTEEKVSTEPVQSDSKQHTSAEATSYLPTLNKQHTTSASTFAYKPMFLKTKKYRAEQSYLDSPSESMSSSESSNLARAFSKSNLNSRTSGEGMITFFKDSLFFADASSDSTPVNWKLTRHVIPWVTLGAHNEVVDESPLRHHDACYFAPQFAAKPYVAAANEGLPVFHVSDISSSGEVETRPVELPASGIGGTHPEDNFALDVKVVRRMHKEKESLGTVPLTGTRKRKRYSYRPINCEKLSLQPSRLPAPGYIFLTSGSSSGGPDNSEEHGSETSSSADEDFPPLITYLHQWSTEGSGEEADEHNETESIDMLAMARAADPDRIAAAERDFVMTDPADTARQAGSLAATVGASRSASPASEDMGDVDDERVSSNVAELESERDLGDPDQHV